MATKDLQISSSNVIEVNLFIRGEKAGDVELIEKMMRAIDINSWEIRDILTHDPKTFPPCKTGIAFGSACGRIIQQLVKTNHLLILPALKQLYPTKENNIYRKKAWKSLESVKDLLQGKIDNKPEDSDWGYAILRVGDKRLCIYSKKKPVDIENKIDAYLNEGDCKQLLDIYKAFKANSITFGSSDDNESNSNP